MNPQVSQEDIRLMMQRLDTDEDGIVEWEEWRELLVLLPHNHCEELFSSWYDSAALWQPSIPSGHDSWEDGSWWKHFIGGGE